MVHSHASTVDEQGLTGRTYRPGGDVARPRLTTGSPDTILLYFVGLPPVQRGYLTESALNLPRKDSSPSFGGQYRTPYRRTLRSISSGGPCAWYIHAAAAATMCPLCVPVGLLVVESNRRPSCTIYVVTLQPNIRDTCI